MHYTVKQMHSISEEQTRYNIQRLNVVKWVIWTLLQYLGVISLITCRFADFG